MLLKYFITYSLYRVHLTTHKKQTRHFGDDKHRFNFYNPGLNQAFPHSSIQVGLLKLVPNTCIQKR
jgi:hypothetical protein